jgi:hypothetical protein
MTAAEAAAAQGAEELESALDEVITHMRDELRHGTWPTSPPDPE